MKAEDIGKVYKELDNLKTLKDLKRYRLKGPGYFDISLRDPGSGGRSYFRVSAAGLLSFVEAEIKRIEEDLESKGVDL